MYLCLHLQASGPAEHQAGSLALYKVRLWLKIYLLYTHVVTQVIHISPAPSTITPTSLECQDCELAHRIPRPLCFTGLQVSVMCGSALPPADHERMNRPADLRMAPPGASLQRFSVDPLSLSFVVAFLGGGFFSGPLCFSFLFVFA